MLEFLSRDEFLRLLRLKSTTLDQRVLMGQAAFAFGCQKPAHVGEYLVLDAVAMLLSSILNQRAGLELKPAADAVREHWEGWLALVTKDERFPIADDPQLFFAVAWLWIDHKLTHRVVMGGASEIAAALAGEPVDTVNSISIRRVLHHLRSNAQLAKVALPERLTIAPNEPGYENWRAEIRAYQERAGARFQARAKNKKQRPARASARKWRLLRT
jgi:hypothetical protein